MKKKKMILSLLVLGCLTATLTFSSNANIDITKKCFYEAQASGFIGTYEDWLKLIKGDKGDQGDKGPKGNTGAAGLKGDPGNNFLTGNGVPTQSLGSNGDYYLDNKTFDYYSKSNNAWSLQFNIIGYSKVKANEFTFTSDDLSSPIAVNNLYDNMNTTISQALSGTMSYNSKYRFNHYQATPGSADPQYFYDEESKQFYIFGTCWSGSTLFTFKRTSDFRNYDSPTLLGEITDSTWLGYHPISNDVYPYAAECIKIGNKYYLYYSACSKVGSTFYKKHGYTYTGGNNGVRYNSIFVSDKITGPFIEAGGATPVFYELNQKLGTSALDMSPFIDSDGSLYVYFSVDKTAESYGAVRKQEVWGIKMKDPLTPDYSTLKKLVIPGELTINTENDVKVGWEALAYTRVAEGPFMIKSPVNNKYYLIYTANHYTMMPYTMCYAVSSSPLGTYEKPVYEGGEWTNVFLGFAGDYYGNFRDGGKSTDPVYGNISKEHLDWEGFNSGTGHGGFFKVGNEYFCCFHAHGGRTQKAYEPRNDGFDQVYFDPDTGVPFVNGPSSSILPMPSALTGYSDITDKATMITNNITQSHRLTDKYMVAHYWLPQENYKEATLNKGESYVKFTFDKAYDLSTILVFNSATYSKRMVNNIKYIRFDDGNGFTNIPFPSSYVDNNKGFIFPFAPYTIDIPNTYRAQSVTIAFNNETPVNCNEIMIYGR